MGSMSLTSILHSLTYIAHNVSWLCFFVSSQYCHVLIQVWGFVSLIAKGRQHSFIAILKSKLSVRLIEFGIVCQKLGAKDWLCIRLHLHEYPNSFVLIRWVFLESSWSTVWFPNRIIGGLRIPMRIRLLYWGEELQITLIIFYDKTCLNAKITLKSSWLYIMSEMLVYSDNRKRLCCIKLWNMVILNTQFILS